MIELSEQNVADYLFSTGRAAPGPQKLLVQSLSGGVANVVLKIFDPNAGPKVGTDMRSESQKKRHVPDTRMNQGACFVLKQPLEKFKTAAEWHVDRQRVLLERDCMILLAQLLPKGSVPEVLWFDEANQVLAISCAPTDSVIWKKQLLAGRVSSEAAMHAGMLLAMQHSSTRNAPDVAARYGEDRLFVQQRTDPYLVSLLPKHPDLARPIERLVQELLTRKDCLIHGDFSPKNIFLVPYPDGQVPPPPPRRTRGSAGATPRPSSTFPLSHLLLLDFEVAYYGPCAFDVATLINHLLLKAFYLGKPWRACMIAIDAFWQTYLHTADKALTSVAEQTAGRMLGGLLLARVDGKSPVEYLPDEAVSPIKQTLRAVAREILLREDGSLESALDTVAAALHSRWA